MKKKFLSILQLVFGIAIIAFFVNKMRSEGTLYQFLEATKNAASSWHLLALATFLFLVCLILTNLRWQTLLKAQNINLSFFKSLTLYFIGHFFSIFLPGATTGDILKAVYVAQAAPDRKTEAVSTIVIDRAIGLVALVLLSTVVMLARLDFFLSFDVTRAALILNSCLLAGVIIAAVIVFRKNIFEHSALFKKLEEKTAVGKIISRIYTAFHVCIRSWRTLVITMIYSFANHILFVCIACLVGYAIGLKISIADYFTVFPIINALAGLPLTPGGLGVRDAAAKFLLGALGVAEPVAISTSLLIYLVTLFWSFVGGIVYAIFVFQGANAAVSPENNQKQTHHISPA